MGIATQSVCLTACSLGLGTVVVGLFNHEKDKGVLRVGQGYELLALVPLGYPAQEPSAPKRKEIGDFTHYETFS